MLMVLVPIVLLCAAPPEAQPKRADVPGATAKSHNQPKRKVLAARIVEEVEAAPVRLALDDNDDDSPPEPAIELQVPETITLGIGSTEHGGPFEYVRYYVQTSYERSYLLEEGMPGIKVGPKSDLSGYDVKVHEVVNEVTPKGHRLKGFFVVLIYPNKTNRIGFDAIIEVYDPKDDWPRPVPRRATITWTWPVEPVRKAERDTPQPARAP